MRVKIGDKIYNPKDEPIMLILDPIDRLNIMAMPPSNNIHCIHPTGYPQDKLEAFMKLPENKKPDASGPLKPVPTPNN
jgi:hypothetical protein